MNAMRFASDTLNYDHIAFRADGSSPEYSFSAILDYPLILLVSRNSRPELGFHLNDQDQKS